MNFSELIKTENDEGKEKHVLNITVDKGHIEGHESKGLFEETVLAAGRTKVVCAGSSSVDVEGFLRLLHDQIFVSGASGNATGRNIHQKSLEEAVRMCNAD